MNATGDGTPAPRRSARADRTRTALIDAALRLFARQGVEATRVEEITRAARVAKGTFYVHFQRKHDVLLEHASALLDTLGEPAPTGTVAEALVRWCHLLGQSFQAAPAAVAGPMADELTCHPGAWARVAAGRPTLPELLTPLIARGQAGGELRDDVPARRLAQLLAFALLGATRDRAVAVAGPPLEALLREAAEVFLHGAAGPGRPAR